MKTSPVPYIRDTKLRGSLFKNNPDEDEDDIVSNGELVSSVDTGLGRSYQTAKSLGMGARESKMASG